jgi:hypothetical protein
MPSSLAAVVGVMNESILHRLPKMFFSRLRSLHHFCAFARIISLPTLFPMVFKGIRLAQINYPSSLLHSKDEGTLRQMVN